MMLHDKLSKKNRMARATHIKYISTLICRVQYKYPIKTFNRFHQNRENISTICA